jgi:hypothetical protein
VSGGPAAEREADAVSLVQAVEVPRRPAALLEPIIGGSRFRQLDRAADQVRRLLAGRTIWHVNSTATGGGVAEMLQVLVGYVNDFAAVPLALLGALVQLGWEKGLGAGTSDPATAWRERRVWPGRPPRATEALEEWSPA